MLWHVWKTEQVLPPLTKRLEKFTFGRRKSRRSKKIVTRYCGIFRPVFGSEWTCAVTSVGRQTASCMVVEKYMGGAQAISISRRFFISNPSFERSRLRSQQEYALPASRPLSYFNIHTSCLWIYFLICNIGLSQAIIWNMYTFQHVEYISNIENLFIMR